MVEARAAQRGQRPDRARLHRGALCRRRRGRTPAAWSSKPKWCGSRAASRATIRALSSPISGRRRAGSTTQVYCARGDIENRIKELHDGLADRAHQLHALLGQSTARAPHRRRVRPLAGTPAARRAHRVRARASHRRCASGCSRSASTSSAPSAASSCICPSIPPDAAAWRRIALRARRPCRRKPARSHARPMAATCCLPRRHVLAPLAFGRASVCPAASAARQRSLIPFTDHHAEPFIDSRLHVVNNAG